jgi:plastocyanin
VEEAISITNLFHRVPYLAVAGLVASCVFLAAGESQLKGEARNRGSIQGRVLLTAAVTPAIPSGVYPSRRVSRPAAAAAEIANVIVFLRDVPQTSDLAPVQATIVQKDEAFVPRVLAITRGSTVAFPNSDPFFHNVFSLSRNSAFDLGRYPRGENRTRTFNRPGLVKLYCHIHSHMTAGIMVFDHPYFARPSADGRFTIDDVPAGTYRVSAWHERIGESVRTVRLDAGRLAMVEFALPVGDR